MIESTPHTWYTVLCYGTRILAAICCLVQLFWIFHALPIYHSFFYFPTFSMAVAMVYIMYWETPTSPDCFLLFHFFVSISVFSLSLSLYSFTHNQPVPSLIISARCMRSDCINLICTREWPQRMWTSWAIISIKFQLIIRVWRVSDDVCGGTLSLKLPILEMIDISYYLISPKNRVCLSNRCARYPPPC